MFYIFLLKNVDIIVYIFWHNLCIFFVELKATTFKIDWNFETILADNEFVQDNDEHGGSWSTYISHSWVFCLNLRESVFVHFPFWN